VTAQPGSSVRDQVGRHRQKADLTWAVVPGRIIALAVTAVTVGAIFLGPVTGGARHLPVGFDTTGYLYRAKAVIAEGVGALDEITPPGLRLGTNPERPGYPVIAALVDSVLGIDPLLLSLIIPAVMAVAVALAVGAFATMALREPDWAFPIFGIATGASLLVARTAVGSIDNLTFDPILLALLGSAVAFADRDRGLAGALVLAAGGVLIHWNLVMLGLGLLLGLAVVFAIPSLLLRRRGERWWHTPSPRLLAVAGGCVATGAASFLAAPGFPERLPDIPMVKIRKKNAERLPALRLPFFALVSGFGALAAWLAADTRRRMGAALLIVWASTLPFAALLLEAGRRIPVYRVATFALALPMLAALLITTSGRLLARRAPAVGLLVGVVLGGAGLWAMLPWTIEFWRSREPVASDRLGQALTAGAYLGSSGRGSSTPVVFLVSSQKITLPDHLIRAGVPPEAVDDVYLFPGKPAELRDLQSGDTGSLSDPSVDRRRLAARAVVADVLDADPIILFLTTFNEFRMPPDAAVQAGPGVYVIQGPRPVQPGAAVPAKAGIGDAVSFAMLLLIVGSGWAVALVGGSILVRGGLAMAFGVALLALVGTVVGRVGVPLKGGAAYLLVGGHPDATPHASVATAPPPPA
jgi:hypothetical protein